MLNKIWPAVWGTFRKIFQWNAIPKLYNDERERVVEELESVKYYAATTDMWSSDTGAPFLSYTVHFIDEDWQLKSRLQALYLPADHTANNLADSLSSILEKAGKWFFIVSLVTTQYCPALEYTIGKLMI